MEKLLVCVDMQNDFVTGVLGSKEAQEIVPAMVEFMNSFDGEIVFTKDTHSEDYLETQEGKILPVKHCVKKTEGWKIIPELGDICSDRIFEKGTFGSMDLARYIKENQPKEIHFVGVCTGICVISNAVMAKAFCPEAKIVIHKDLCACVTPKSHETALDAMKTLQMFVE